MSEVTTQTGAKQLSLVQQYIRISLSRREPDTLLTTAWQDFYRYHAVLIRKLVLSRGLRGTDVDDCVQDVWVEVIQRIPQFVHREERPGLHSWLYTLVRSKAVGLRQNERRRGMEDFGETDEPRAREPDPATSCQNKCERDQLERLVAALQSEVSEKNARLLQMRLVENRKVVEVAAELRIKPQQVWYRQHRLLTKLRARWARRNNASRGTWKRRVSRQRRAWP